MLTFLLPSVAILCKVLDHEQALVEQDHMFLNLLSYCDCPLQATRDHEEPEMLDNGSL